MGFTLITGSAQVEKKHSLKRAQTQFYANPIPGANDGIEARAMN